MDIATGRMAVILLVLLAVMAGGVFLQIFLAKRESRWPGLVLPLLTFLMSLLGPLNVVNTGDMASALGAVAVALLLGNIPTLILLAIYWAGREKLRKRSELDKMQIDDL
ncbi:MAG: hypothetical protein RR035_04505 [Oscillibacter sp.]